MDKQEGPEIKYHIPSPWQAFKQGALAKESPPDSYLSAPWPVKSAFYAGLLITATAVGWAVLVILVTFAYYPGLFVMLFPATMWNFVRYQMKPNKPLRQQGRVSSLVKDLVIVGVVAVGLIVGCFLDSSLFEKIVSIKCK